MTNNYETPMTHAELQSWMDEMEYDLANPIDCLRCNDKRFIDWSDEDHSACWDCNKGHAGCTTCKSLRANSPFNAASEAWAKMAEKNAAYKAAAQIANAIDTREVLTPQPNGHRGLCLICDTANYVVTANGKRPAAEEAYICSGDCTDAYMADCAGTKGEDW